MGATIVTLGGGGFSMSDDGASPIDDYLLALTGATHPRVCFVATASGDSNDYIRRFREAFAGRARTSEMVLFAGADRPYTGPEALAEQDLIYVGGGSTANLLALWRLHGVDTAMRAAADRGTVLAGISAGMNCWFEQSSTDSFGTLRALNDGLGMLAGSACPHYLGEPERRESFQRAILTRALAPGYAVDDYAALVWRNGVLEEAIAERSDRPAFFVDVDADRAVEHALTVRQLP